ncbi:MBL fold hydrolase [Streptomyces cinereus]|nr:MBL fold metallo-hydrolase [Moraxella sp. CTOTU47579]GGM03628.1 MBL fold hydrolase [Streptomyces cinereus]
MVTINIIDAGYGDCLLLDFIHTKILIDCGPKNFKIRKSVLSSLKTLVGEDGKLDIAIVTHNDDDHIGGFKYLIDENVEISKIIFNSVEDIPDILKNTEKQISFPQDNELRLKILKDKDITPIFLYRGSEPLQLHHIKIIPLTPTNEILKNIYKFYNSKILNNESAQKQISSSIESEITLGEALKKVRENKDRFEKDPSITNKSSISFIIESNNFTGLFLGDAHAEDILEGLKISGYINKKFNVVKLSHHGSHRNTSSELLEAIGKTEYIICANKTKHNHPNNVTLARILNYNPNPTFHLSSDSSTLTQNIEACVALGFKPTITIPKSGINKLTYE